MEDYYCFDCKKKLNKEIPLIYCTMCETYWCHDCNSVIELFDICICERCILEKHKEYGAYRQKH